MKKDNDFTQRVASNVVSKLIIETPGVLGAAITGVCMVLIVVSLVFYFLIYSVMSKFESMDEQAAWAFDMNTTRCGAPFVIDKGVNHTPPMRYRPVLFKITNMTDQHMVNLDVKIYGTYTKSKTGYNDFGPGFKLFFLDPYEEPGFKRKDPNMITYQQNKDDVVAPGETKEYCGYFLHHGDAYTFRETGEDLYPEADMIFKEQVYFKFDQFRNKSRYCKGDRLEIPINVDCGDMTSRDPQILDKFKKKEES